MEIAGNFTYSRLFKFTLPTIIMMIFVSLYEVVDGFFVSNYAGKSALASLNFAMPILMILGAIGFIFGTGGSAIIAKTLGEKNNLLANKYFSMIVYSDIILGIIFAILGIVYIEPIIKLFGADDVLLTNSVLYARTILVALPFFVTQTMFQTLFITAGKPKLGLFVTIFSGCTNMFLDYLLVGYFHFGLVGAAVATAISQGIGGIIPLIYFSFKNSSSLRLTKTNIELKIIAKASVNGMSEMLSNISVSIISMFYMWQLMKYAGENGVAAYGVIMYIQFAFVGILMGYSLGVSPIISYNYGAKNVNELQNLFKKSLTIIASLGIVLTSFAEIFSSPMAQIFVGYDKTLLEITVHGCKIFYIAFLVAGFNVFASAFYTALNNGIISGVISFARTFIFQCIAILFLPLFFGINGVWSAEIFAELFALILTTALLIKTRKEYNYI